MGALVEYSPRQIVAHWGPTPLTLGIPEGHFLSVSRNRPTWSSLKGGDGEAARVRTNDFSGIVLFTLRRGSQANTALTVQLQIDEATGVIVAPFMLKDFAGLTLWTSPRAYLEGFPVDTYGDSEGTRDWALICDPLFPFPGGSVQR